MRKSSAMLASLALASLLTLTACGGSDSNEDDPGGVLTAVGENKPTETPSVKPMPAPPVNSLKDPDLSTPENVVLAYTAYTYVGDGANACMLLAGEALDSYGLNCEGAIQQYAESLYRSYDNSIDVAKLIKVNTSAKTATTARVTGLIEVSAGVKYFDTFDLSLINGEWKITSNSRLKAEPLD